MTDPKLDLKLPLRLLPESLECDLWKIVDANSFPIHMTKHRAEVIVAALEADAEKASPCHPGCVPVGMLGETIVMHVEGCPNAEKEETT